MMTAAYPSLRSAQEANTRVATVAGSTSSPTTLNNQLGNNMTPPYLRSPCFNPHTCHTTSLFNVQARRYATNAGRGLNTVEISLMAPSLLYTDANVNGKCFRMDQTGGVPEPSATGMRHSLVSAASSHIDL
jgi:hypothetical protein